MGKCQLLQFVHLFTFSSIVATAVWGPLSEFIAQPGLGPHFAAFNTYIFTAE